jgi:hypothetical protein
LALLEAPTSSEERSPEPSEISDETICQAVVLLYYVIFPERRPNSSESPNQKGSSAEEEQRGSSVDIDGTELLDFDTLKNNLMKNEDFCRILRKLATIRW